VNARVEDLVGRMTLEEKVAQMLAIWPLVSQLGGAAVRGLQCDTLPLDADKVFATLKHFTGHGQPERKLGAVDDRNG
jgi:hypothetical protein